MNYLWVNVTEYLQSWHRRNYLRFVVISVGLIDSRELGITVSQSVTLPLKALTCPRFVLLSIRLRFALREGLVGFRF